MRLNHFKFLLVALLALLQCLAPLIHGHLGGHADAHEGIGEFYAHFHADEFNTALASASDTPAFTAASDETPAIGVSQEFRQDNFLLPILGFVVAVFLVAVSRKRPAVFPRVLRTAIRTVFHSRPPATAPPARAA